MELLQKVLNGADPETILYEWKESDSNQVTLKQTIKDLVNKLPDSKSELSLSISHPLFSLSLCPDLIKKCLKLNNLVLFT